MDTRPALVRDRVAEKWAELPLLRSRAIIQMLVHGTEDRIVPARWAKRAHRLMKNSKIEMIPECGHLPPVEKPDLFNRIILGFLLNKCASIG